MLPSRIVPDAFRSALLALFVVVVTRRWEGNRRHSSLDSGQQQGPRYADECSCGHDAVRKAARSSCHPQQPAPTVFHIHHRHLLLLLILATGACHLSRPTSVCSMRRFLMAIFASCRRLARRRNGTVSAWRCATGPSVPSRRRRLPPAGTLSRRLRPGTTTSTDCRPFSTFGAALW